jgi:di/tricarboxylate transporter
VDARVLGGAGIAIAAIGLWATGAIAEWIAALALFTGAMLLKIAPASVVFSGFQAAALWLVVGGLVVGAAVGKTGLGARIARTLLPLFGRSYLGIVAGSAAIGLALAFLLPSSLGRIVILMPILIALADGFGFGPGSNGRAGMVLACGLGTFLVPFTILPAAVPPMVMAGLAEKLYGYVPLYAEYLLLHFPVLGFLKLVALIAIVVWLLPDTPRAGPAEAERPKPMSGEERRLAGIVAISLALWVTDFLHHISPAWISLAAAIAVVAPGIGVMSAQEAQSRVNWASAIYIAGVLSLGTIIADTGVGDLLGRAFLGIVALEPGEDARTFGAVAGATALLSMATTQPGIPTVMVPLAGDIARAAGLSVPAILMMQVIGYSTLILPYQGPPIVVALQLGGVPVAVATRITLALTAATVLVLAPLDYLWWLALGAFR